MKLKIYLIIPILFISLVMLSQDILWTDVADSTSWNGSTIITAENELIATWRTSDSVIIVKYMESGDVLSQVKTAAEELSVEFDLIEGENEELYFLGNKGKLYKYVPTDSKLEFILDLAEFYQSVFVRNIAKNDTKVEFTGNGNAGNGNEILKGTIDLVNHSHTSSLFDEGGYSSGLSLNKNTLHLAETRSHFDVHHLIIYDQDENIIANNIIQWTDQDLRIRDIFYSNDEILIAGSKSENPEYTIGVLCSVSPEGQINWVKNFEPGISEFYVEFSSVLSYDNQIYLGGGKGHSSLTDIYFVSLNENKAIEFEIQLEPTTASNVISELDVLSDTEIIASGMQGFTDVPADHRAFVMSIQDRTTSLNELTPNNFAIHPNPVHSFLWLDNSMEGLCGSIEIYDSNGAIIKWFDYPVEKIDVSDLSQGTHFLKLTCDKASKISRFIKM